MDERRQYPRVNAPIFCRPVGKPLFGRRKALDVSAGGMRIYSDDPVEVGDRLELDLMLDQGQPILCTVEIVWVDTLPSGDPAKYDVGVKFVELRDVDKARLEQVLKAD